MSTDGTPATATPLAPARQRQELPQSAVERIARKTARMIAERQKAETERDLAKQELETLREQVKTLSKTSTETETLKAELRTLKHRQVADKILVEAGINPEATDAFYTLSGMKFEGDAPDEAKVKAFVEEAKPKLSYLFNGQTQEGGATPPVPGPGRGQGGTGQPPAGRFQVTQEQLRDPAWCFAHKAELAAAAKDVMGMPVSQVGDKFTIL